MNMQSDRKAEILKFIACIRSSFANVIVIDITFLSLLQTNQITFLSVTNK